MTKMQEQTHITDLRQINPDLDERLMVRRQRQDVLHEKSKEELFYEITLTDAVKYFFKECKVTDSLDKIWYKTQLFYKGDQTLDNDLMEFGAQLAKVPRKDVSSYSWNALTHNFAILG